MGAKENGDSLQGRAERLAHLFLSGLTLASSQPNRLIRMRMEAWVESGTRFR